MNLKLPTTIILFLFLLLFNVSAFAQQSNRNVEIDGQLFLSFEHAMQDDDYENRFSIKRGYVNFRGQLSEQVGVRVTQDVSIDEEGDGAGDIELRLKYAYVKYDVKASEFFTKMSFSGGVVGRPWIGFEQKVNDYRAQKSMFLDQNKFLSSADYGVNFETGLGEQLDVDGLKSNAGKFGSFAVGVYNGGGYSAIEKNNNKLVEARLTLRPLLETFPGIQTTFFGAYGKGNAEFNPDFELMGAALTYESQRFNLVVQGFSSVGDGQAKYLHPTSNKAYQMQGWSAFGEVQPIKKYPVSLTLRAEELYNVDLDVRTVREGAAGIAYVFKNRSKIILDYGYQDSPLADFHRVGVIGEVRF